MPFLIGRSLSRGHERSSPDATVSTLRSLSKFSIALLGRILFVALVALGMSGPASAAVTAVSYSASGELNDPNFNITPFDIQNSSTNTTNNFSGRVSLVLNNKLFRVSGATADAFANAHAAFGSLGVDAFASAVAGIYQAASGVTTEASASFSDTLIYNWKNPKKFGKPVVLRSDILLDGGFSATNIYQHSAFFPPFQDYVSSLSISRLIIACNLCGALPNGGVLGSSTRIFDDAADPQIVEKDVNPPEMIQVNTTVPSGVAIPIALTLDVRSIVGVNNRDSLEAFTGEAVAEGDFTKTLALGPLTFIDPSTGLALSESDFSLVSDSGYDYLHPAVFPEPPAIPEPPIYALLLSGLLTLAVAAAVTKKPRVRPTRAIVLSRELVDPRSRLEVVRETSQALVPSFC
jgi:hypothetical protein